MCSNKKDKKIGNIVAIVSGLIFLIFVLFFKFVQPVDPVERIDMTAGRDIANILTKNMDLTAGEKEIIEQYYRELDAVKSKFAGLDTLKIKHIDANSGEWAIFPFEGVGVSQAADQAIPNNTNTDIIFDSVAWDDGHRFYDLESPTKITFPTSGIYSVWAYVRFVQNSTGYRAISIRLNGTATFFRWETDASSINQTYLLATVPVIVVAGDYITIEVYQNSGGDLDVDIADASVYRIH